jgi:hypothetical protein
MGKFDPALEFMANFGSFTISTAVTIGNRPYQPPVDSYVQRPVLQNLNYNYNVKATTVSQSENLTLSSFEKSRKATNRIIQNEAGGFNPDGSPGFRQAMAQYKKTDAVFKAIDRFENGPAPVILSFTPIGRVGGIAGAGRSLLIEDGIAIFTSSRSMAASRTYTIFDGSGKLYKFGVTDAKLARYGQSLKQAGPGSYGRYSSIMPKFEAHISEKYLRSLHFSSTGQYALPGMRVPFPLDFSTGLPIKK